MSNPSNTTPSDGPPAANGEDALPEADRRLFELLDQYVENLHQEDLPSRSVLLERHPELTGLLCCLESLDSLALPILEAPPQSTEISSPVRPALEIDSDRTVIWSSDFSAGESASPTRAGQPPNALPEFGKYQLLEELGRGGMGVVYRAWQTDLQRHVAVKMILHSRLASAEDVRRFYVEARSAGGLTHPNVVRIHEVGQVGGQHYFTMEYVDGPSLADRSRQGPHAPDEAAKRVATIARAVHYLHQHGIVHRDLKPSNVLLDAEGTPYVTDFGLAKVFDATDSGKTQSGTIVGTPSYMSPEQAAGHTSRISPSCDTYSLGAILYELLCGRPPFQRETPLDTLVEVIESEPTLLCKQNPAIPRDLELICLRCLEKEPEKRYPSAEALAEDLERYLRGEPVEARPSGFITKLRRWGRREPALVSRLTGLLLASTIVQGRYLFTSDTDPEYHYRIMGVFGTWALTSFLFQRMLHNDSMAQPARYGWAASDVMLLTSLLYLADPPLGPLLIGYPLLIAATGLFFLVRLVLFMTVVSLVSFAALIVLRPDALGERPHYLIIFGAVLAVMGLIIAHQVHRVRALSRYYEQRRP